jgi:hypothetical protein
LLDTVLYFNRPFGILVDCFDQVRTGGMRQSIHRLLLEIDSEAVYQVQIDTLFFDMNRLADFEFDYQEAVNDHKRVRRLFHESDHVIPGRIAMNESLGVIGQGNSLRPGLHRATITGEDNFGKRSKLSFSFVWGPDSGFLQYDSVAYKDKSHGLFHFTRLPAYQSLQVDSLYVLYNSITEWKQHDSVKISHLDNNHTTVEIRAQRVDRRPLRLMIAESSGCHIEDTLFTGLRTRGPNKYDFRHEVVEDGMYVYVDSPNRVGSEAKVELYYKDTLLGTEYPSRYLNMSNYVIFIPPLPKYRRIDRILFAFSREPKFTGVSETDLDIMVVGLGSEEEIAADEFCTVRFGEGTFYKPQFIEMKKMRVGNKSMLRLNSDSYTIFPSAFVTRKDFEMEVRLRGINMNHKKSGICWLDEKKDRWVWLENSFDNNRLKAESRGGGIFAAVFDLEMPEITKMNIRAGAKVRDRWPTIRFQLTDSLSGIEDDRDITIKLDGTWLIPEYDPESGECKARPESQLDYGNHHLAIIVSDRAGNVNEQYLQFTVAHGRKRR